jgi:ribosomal protein L40E
MRKPIDPRHAETRSTLRVVGPCVLGAGAIFTLIGFGSFFAAFGSFGPPRYFWCAFIGLPLVAVGGAITKFAYLGAVTRYMADEVAPVGKDVINYMADGTKGAVRDLASAVGEGLGLKASAEESAMVRCPKCDADNETSANFCKQCGSPLARSRICHACGHENAPDAQFCDRCGRPVGSGQ